MQPEDEDRSDRSDRASRPARRRLSEVRGYDVVPISRSIGVDVITGEGLDQAFDRRRIDRSTSPPGPRPISRRRRSSSRPPPATCRRPVSGPACGGWSWCRSSGSTSSAAATTPPSSPTSAVLEGPIPARIVRAARSTSSWKSSCAGARRATWLRLEMRTQLVSARTVAEALVDLATAPDPAPMPPRPRRSPVRARSVSSRPRACWPRVAATPAGRGAARPLGPRQRALRERRRPARTGRQARRPDVRGVAGRDGARRPGLAREAGSGGAGPRRRRPWEPAETASCAPRSLSSRRERPGAGGSRACCGRRGAAGATGRITLDSVGNALCRRPVQLTTAGRPKRASAEGRRSGVSSQATACSGQPARRVPS